MRSEMRRDGGPEVTNNAVTAKTDAREKDILGTPPCMPPLAGEAAAIAQNTRRLRQGILGAHAPPIGRTVLIGQFTAIAYFQNALHLRRAASNHGLRAC
jgi:hypothetical protein